MLRYQPSGAALKRSPLTPDLTQRRIVSSAKSCGEHVNLCRQARHARLRAAPKQPAIQIPGDVAMDIRMVGTGREGGRKEGRKEGWTSVMTCEPVIRRQGCISYQGTLDRRLAADGCRVMACDRLFWLTCRRRRENSPEGRKGTGKQIQGKRHVAEKSFTASDVGLPCCRARLEVSVFPRPREQPRFGSATQTRPYIINPIPCSGAIPEPETLLIRDKPAGIAVPRCCCLGSYMHIVVHGGVSLPSPTDGHSTPTANNLFPSPTPSHQTPLSTEE